MKPLQFGEAETLGSWKLKLNNKGEIKMKLTGKINEVFEGIGNYIEMNEVEYKDEKEMYKYQAKLKGMYKENGLNWSSYNDGFRIVQEVDGFNYTSSPKRYYSKGTIEEMLENAKIRKAIPIEEQLKGFSKSELNYIVSQKRQDILNK